MIKKRTIFLVLVSGLLLVGLAGGLFYFGLLQINNPSYKKFPVRGVDVASYQGTIDWSVLEEQGVRFAFVKATEGSGHRDGFFEQNWAGLDETEIIKGAYHFFSFDSAGATQADHFIATVPKESGMLPPVVDVEFYDWRENDPPSVESVVTELDDLLRRLEDHYGVRPIIYITEPTYQLYIKDHFPDHPLWVRAVYGQPRYVEESRWVFWQYSNRKPLKGYTGPERYIDMNLYDGTMDELKENLVS